MTDAPAGCPFCNAEFLSEQVLIRTASLLLIAPRGQPTPGYLGIYSRRCGDAPERLRCIADVAASSLSRAREIETLVHTVRCFYAEAYGAGYVAYEHGRGGGHRSRHVTKGYPFHPHLCFLPGTLRLPADLDTNFDSIAITGLAEMRRLIGRRPYIYVETDAGHRSPVRRAYVSRTADDLDISGYGFKEAVSASNGLDGETDWRADPDEAYLRRTLKDFEVWIGSKATVDPIATG